VAAGSKSYKMAPRAVTGSAARAAGCRLGLNCNWSDGGRLATLNQLTTLMCLPWSWWSSESVLGRGEGVLKHDTVYSGNVSLLNPRRQVESAVTCMYHLLWDLGIVWR
jgi:hypothetical protein